MQEAWPTKLSVSFPTCDAWNVITVTNLYHWASIRHGFIEADLFGLSEFASLLKIDFGPTRRSIALQDLLKASFNNLTSVFHPLALVRAIDFVTLAPSPGAGFF